MAITRKGTREMARKQSSCTPASEPCGPSSTMRRGSSGDDVRALQAALTALGHDTGGADGVFGSKTEASVRLYQAVNGLVVDGVVGAKTHTALGPLQ